MPNLKKIIDNLVKYADGTSAPAPGNGKLTEYKDKNDSWILNQMRTQEVDPAIKIKNKKPNFKQFYNHPNDKEKLIANIIARLVTSTFVLKSVWYTGKDSLKLLWSVPINNSVHYVEEINDTSNILLKYAKQDLKTLKDSPFVDFKSTLGEPRVFFESKKVILECWIVLSDESAMIQTMNDLIIQHGFQKEEWEKLENDEFESSVNKIHANNKGENL